MNTIFKILGLILGLGALSAFPIYQVLKSKNEAPRAFLGQNQAILEAELAQAHQEALNAIQQEFGIPVDQWRVALMAYKALVQKDTLLKPFKGYKKSSDELTNFIKELLCKAGINPDRVEIVYRPNIECPVVARQECDDTQIWHYLDIDRDWIVSRPQKARAAILSHEFQHFKNYDSVESGFIIEVLEKNGFTFNDYQNSAAVRHYRHAREFRADLLAGLQDIDIAQALLEDLQTLNMPQDPTHPSSTARTQQLAQLIANMQEPVTQTV